MLPVLETAAHSPLTIVWFILITVLWVGFFFLEGFDFGVAMLLPFMGRDDKDRRLMVNTIGPTWDGNEVWLLTAVVPPSRPSPAGTRRCSPASTCRCC